MYNCVTARVKEYPHDYDKGVLFEETVNFKTQITGGHFSPVLIVQVFS